jgi:serine/threonine protein kinase
MDSPLLIKTEKSLPQLVSNSVKISDADHDSLSFSLMGSRRSRGELLDLWTYDLFTSDRSRRDKYAVDMWFKFKDSVVETNYRKFLSNSSQFRLGRTSFAFAILYFLFNITLVSGYFLSLFQPFYVGPIPLPLCQIGVNLIYLLVYSVYALMSKRKVEGKSSLNYQGFEKLTAFLYVPLFVYIYLITNIEALPSCRDTSCHFSIGPDPERQPTLFKTEHFACMMFFFTQPLIFNLTFMTHVFGYIVNTFAYIIGIILIEEIDFEDIFGLVIQGILLLNCTALFIAFRLESINRTSFIRYCTLREANLETETELNPFTSQNISTWLAELGDKPNPLQRYEIKFEDIVFSDIIAAGGGGQVYRGEYEQRPVAIKQLFTTQMNKDDLNEFSNEVSAMSSLGNNPNIVRFHGISKSGDDVFLVMEYCEKSLADVIAVPSLWPTPKQILEEPAACAYVLRVAKQICSAMAFLHANNFVHLDLKPGNVLLENIAAKHSQASSIPAMDLKQETSFPKWQVKICDFGLARNTKKTKTKELDLLTETFQTTRRNQKMSHTAGTEGMGTALFLAPECLDPLIDNTPSRVNSLSFEQLCKVDVYAFGILLAAMCCNNNIYIKEEAHFKCRGVSAQDVERELLQAVKAGLRPDLPPLPDAITNLIDSCWRTDPKHRPEFRELVLSCVDQSVKLGYSSTVVKTR